jgi:hypothetical protein
MTHSKLFRWVAVGILVLAFTGIGVTQVREIVRAAGLSAAISAFGGEIDRFTNNLIGRKPTEGQSTKVVPILSVGGGRTAIGAAQVSGPTSAVQRTVAVAQVEANLFGNEVRVRGFIPVSSADVSRIQAVDNVGVTALIDIRL